MRRLLTILGVLVIGLTLATPALAGHRDHSRGHHRHHVRHHHGRHFVGFHEPAFHHRHRVRSSFSAGFGFPGHSYGSYYSLAPHFCGLPVVAVPAPVWIPGHYVREDGVRFWVRGHWSR